MLINLSNHPVSKWQEKQIQVAKRKYKTIYDIPFPHISPRLGTKSVHKKAEKYLEKILKLLKNSKDKNNAVHLMGEFTFVYHMVSLLKKKKITVICSTTERLVEDLENKKIVTFKFVRFREY